MNNNPSSRKYVMDPLRFKNEFWPHVEFYDKQVDVIYSVANNSETYCVAGNMLGKDFVSAFIVLWFFLSRTPCRVVSTSADHSQLSAVLWGEIRRFIQTCKYPLPVERNGPLVINDLHLRKVVNGEICGLSYVIGRVAKKGEGMLGHHIADEGDDIPRTLYLADECSGVDDESYERADTWAARKLMIGNPYACRNFFYRGIKRGDVLAKA